MTLNQTKKVFSIYAEGIFSPELGQAYADEFIEKSKSIDSENWILSIDVIKLNTLGNGTAVLLIEVLKMYLSFPYKKRYITNIKNPICDMQVKQMGEAIPNFNGMTWVDSVDNTI